MLVSNLRGSGGGCNTVVVNVLLDDVRTYVVAVSSVHAMKLPIGDTR